VRIVLVLVLAFLAAMGGVLAGRTLLAKPASETAGASIFAFVLDDLDLDAGQRRAVVAHEEMFARQRAGLEVALRADNVRLAQAIDREHANGPLVHAAIDRSHATMGALQEATLVHLFAVRAVLRPDQARRFDAKVRETLTTGRQ